MSYIPKRLAQVHPANTSETTVYTVPAARKAIIKNITIANTLAGSVMAEVSLVPNSQVAGVANRILPATALPGKSITTLDLSQVIEASDFISIKAGAADALVFTVSGVEVSTIDFPLLGVEVRKNGVTAGQRVAMNFIPGDNIDITVVDDPGSAEVDVTVAVSGNLGHVVKDEGTPLPTRAGLSFAGLGVSVNDDAGNDETVVTIGAGGETDALVFMGGF
jgi:hypothetical protein